MSNHTQTIRAFIAVELPLTVRALLMTVQGELRESMGGAAEAVKWVRPESTHLTLQFLGDVHGEQLAAIQQGIERACVGVMAMSLNLGGLGVFPNPRWPRVVIMWAGMRGGGEDARKLPRLQEAVARQMEPLGFKPDKSFQPHLTLGRVRGTLSSGDLEALNGALRFPQEHPMFETMFKVGSVSLMRSDLQPGGAVYTRLAHVELGRQA